MELENIINNKKNNIGSLCLYLRKRPNLLVELDNSISQKNIDELTLPQKIYIFINNIKNIKCNCGKQKKWKSFKYGWYKTCGDKKCIKNSTIQTNIEIFGFDNPMKNKNIRSKVEETNYKKYGVKAPAMNKSVKEKIKNKLNNRTEIQKNKTIKKRKENWNNKNEQEKEIIKNKIKKSNIEKTKEEKDIINQKRKNTCLKKYNNEYAILSNNIRNKVLNTFNAKFGGNTPFADKNIKNKAIESYKKRHINYIKKNIEKFQCEYLSHEDKGNNNIEYNLLCKRTNREFNIGYSNLRIRILGNIEISPYFRPKYGKSKMENDLLSFIQVNYKNEILTNKKNVIIPYELDIYLPELKLAFEFNGLWWHNELYKENNYHLNKTEKCEQNNIQLIQIFEDDWIYKQDIVKSIILNKLNKTSNKIFARNCEVKEINDNEIIKSFLIINHIQGFIGSKIKIGLFYNNELVSLMIFGNRRVAMGKKSTNEGEYELLRFCNKLNTNVIGGTSKLFNYFIKTYKPIEITTYADRSFSQGNLYKQLGFEFTSKTEPNYYYIIDGIRHHRFNFRKDKLVKEGYDKNKTEHQIMIERKIYRIYDSGNLKFIYK
jgi:hypothetical protein